MNRTLRQTWPKAILVVATVAIGVVAGRAAQPAEPAASDTASATGPMVDGTLTELDVLAPVFVGSTPPPAPAEDDTSLGLGEIVGVQQAVVPDTSSGIPELPVDEAGDLSTPSPVAPSSPLDGAALASPEFVDGLMPIDAVIDALAIEPSEADSDPIDDLGLRPYVDPCAPTPDSGEAPAADCPDGTRATVLPIVSLGDAFVLVQQVGHAAARGASCPETSPAASGGAVLEILTNAPGTLRIDVVDIAGRNGNVGTYSVETAAADATAWDDAVADGVNPNVMSSLIVHCVGLDGLPANANLVALVRFTRTVDGGTAAHLERITTTPAALRPPTLVAPVGVNRLLVSIAHQTGQRASIDAWVSSDGIATCEPSEPIRRLSTSTTITSTADVNALRARGYDETYRQRTTVIFWVPEGRSINVCARTFDNSGPSFRTAQPVQRDATIVHSPDMVVPVVSIESVHANTNLVGAETRVTVGWARGDGCGYFEGTFNEANAVDPPEYEFPCDGGDAAWAAALATNIVVTTGLRNTPTANMVETSAVLPVRARACSGGDADGFGASCPLPATEWYRIPLATVPVRTGICSPGLFETTCRAAHPRHGCRHRRWCGSTGPAAPCRAGRAGWSSRSSAAAGARSCRPPRSWTSPPPPPSAARANCRRSTSGCSPTGRWTGR